MNLSVIGIGRLGLCWALTLEKNGYNVVGMDVNQDYVNAINSGTLKSSENGVEIALAKCRNLQVTTDLAKAIDHANIIFIVVATNTISDGHYDHSIIDIVVSNILAFPQPKDAKHLVICSTTIPGYCDTIATRLHKHNYTVTYNPEFIAQGTILRDQEIPDIVLIGEGCKEIGDILSDIYKKVCTNNPPIFRMKPLEAEITKLALNCALTTKIAFANMVGDVAVAANVNPNIILDAIGSDTRIGNKYLKYGFGFGGVCFPRDNRAFGVFADKMGVYSFIPKAVDNSNVEHLDYQVMQFIMEHTSKTDNDIITITSVTYKPGTDIIEESQQLAYAVRLAQAGYNIHIVESEAVINQLRKKFGNAMFTYEVQK